MNKQTCFPKQNTILSSSVIHILLSRVWCGFDSVANCGFITKSYAFSLFCLIFAYTILPSGHPVNSLTEACRMRSMREADAQLRQYDAQRGWGNAWCLPLPFTVTALAPLSYTNSACETISLFSGGLLPTVGCFESGEDGRDLNYNFQETTTDH
jgi:hypothetical protein